MSGTAITGHVTVGDGTRIAYRWDGSEDAPILLLSNSLGTHLGMWDAQIEAFARHFRVLRYDQRGHGQSDVAAGAYSMDRLGRDAIELLDALGIAQLDFCGLSLGGMVGQWLAVRAPERLRRLVLANTSAFMGPPSAWQARIDGVRAQGMAPLAEASLARWFTAEFPARAPAAVAPVRAMLMACDPVGYAGCCAAIRDMDMRATAAMIATPTLVIAGRHDPATPPPHSEALARAIPDARLAMLEAAHLSNVECPDAFAGEAINFLTSA